MTDLPGDLRQELRRLTRLSRRADVDAERAAYEQRRAQLLAEYELTARVRDEDTGETLVCYPTEWVDEDGTVHPDRIDDLDRAVEIPLSGPGDPDQWDDVFATNRSVARAVEQQHGEVHGANAMALATFASNHYAKAIADLTAHEREEFLTEYYPRNVWPSDEQAAVVETSVEHAMTIARDDSA